MVLSERETPNLRCNSLLQIRELLDQPHTQRGGITRRTMELVRSKHMLSHRWRTLAAALGLRTQES